MLLLVTKVVRLNDSVRLQILPNLFHVELVGTKKLFGVKPCYRPQQ